VDGPVVGANCVEANRVGANNKGELYVGESWGRIV
jgi:hypothetical protein